MSTARRTAETLGFWSLLLLALGLFAWRWTGQASGLSADQSESLVLARSLVDGWGLRLTEWSSSSAGPPNLLWLAVQAVALRGTRVWRRPVQLEDVLPAVGGDCLCVIGGLRAARAAGTGAAGRFTCGLA